MNFLSSSFHIGQLELSNRLIQGPLAGISAAPFRRLFSQFTAPAYTVTEMISAYEVLTKHDMQSRYLYRAPDEKRLCYQLAGTEPQVMADAALKLQELGADLIDINCGCPKHKIRKKGAGSALMDNPEQLLLIVKCIRQHITIPFTVKLRIYGTNLDMQLTKMLEDEGVDALIIHGRRWTDDYDIPCNFRHIGLIKQQLRIPVIANGDIRDHASLHQAMRESCADGYMISRAGCGQPWIYQRLLEAQPIQDDLTLCLNSFIQHVTELSQLESEYQAVIQSRGFIRYYLRNYLTTAQLEACYRITSMDTLFTYLNQFYTCH